MMASYPTLLAKLDRLGISASFICGIHCALISLALVFAPNWLLHKTMQSHGVGMMFFEFLLAGFSIAVALYATGMGWLHHRHPAPLCFAVPGIALLGFGIFNHVQAAQAAGTGLVLIGGLLLTIAHFLNLRLRHNKMRATPKLA